MALTTNLTSFWELEEASGSRADATGTNPLADHNTVGSTTGKVGTAAVFQASNFNYLSHASTAGLQFGGNASATAWIYNTLTFGAAGSDIRFVVGKDEASQREFNLGMNFTTANRVFARMWDGSAVAHLVEATTFGALSDATWYFVHVTYDATTHILSVGVNAGTMNTLDIGGASFTGTAPFYLGGRSFSGSEGYWDGNIDQVGLWARVLSGAEITQLYNGGAGLSYAAMNTTTTVTHRIGVLGVG